MSELHLPWLELSVFVPLLGAAILRARIYRVLPAVFIVAGGAISLLPGQALGQLVLGVGLVLFAFSPSYRKHEGPQRTGSQPH